MKVYIVSYELVRQNEAGGVPMRIAKMISYYEKKGIEAKLFDRWSDKISDCDILHVFKVNIDNYALISYAKKLGKKVIVSSVIPQENAGRIKFSLILHRVFKVNNTHSFLRNELLCADRIVAQTNKEAKFIREVYAIPGKNIVVIPNGVEEKLIQIESVEKDIVLNVGRFDTNKNQITMIRAVKDFKHQVYFVGGGVTENDEYYLLCKKEAESNPNIHFTGWLKNGGKEIVDLYARAKVVTLLSHKEIFGNSLIEGGASGANLVATNVLPIEEWGIEDFCISVSPNSINEIRQGIERAYDAPIDGELRKRVIELFSWECIVEKYVELYKEVLAEERE